MILAIDCGNTNTKFALCEGVQVKRLWRCNTYPQQSLKQYLKWLQQLMHREFYETSDISGCIISCVVPKRLEILTLLCKVITKRTPLIVGNAGVNIGIDILLEHPEQVGADLVANAIGAYERYKGPLIIIDFGTATTFDVIDQNGNFCGSVFAPGINISLKALQKSAALLPKIEIERPNSVIGKSTKSAMQSGLYWGYIGLIEGMVTRIKNEFGSAMTVVATGGLSPLYADATDVIKYTDKELTIRGLCKIYELNT